MSCTICGSKTIKQKFRIGKFKINECETCHLVMLDHNFSFAKVKELYKKKYFSNPDYDIGYIDYGAVEKSLRINFAKRAKKIKKSIPKKFLNLLDVGTSTGYFLSECRELGISGEGIEISEEASEFAKKQLKLKVHKSALEDFCYTKKFDVITAWDVIEHSAYPRKFLKKIYSLLKKDGHFFFTTGDISSMCSKLSGHRWHLFNLPDHLFFYSQKTISQLLENEGFRVKSITYPWNWYELGYIIERLLKKVVGLKNVKLIKLLSYNVITRKIIVPVNLFDIMEVEVIKK